MMGDPSRHHEFPDGASTASGRSSTAAAFTRRGLIAGAGIAVAASPLHAFALAGGAATGDRRFQFDTVVARAQALGAAPFDATIPPLPQVVANLDYDAYRDIRFRKDKAFLAEVGPFRMELMHRGFLFQRPVHINIVRDGVAARIPYKQSLFDFGRTKVEADLPDDLGFAGLRFMFPLNTPAVEDELISFLGASYFRFLGRGQRYGLSARALAIDIGLSSTEEFPFFREFWIEQPGDDAKDVVLYALLDTPSLAGAYTFTVRPGAGTVVSVAARLFFRRAVHRLGIAPLTSMYNLGASDPRPAKEFRPQVHDSDGVLIHASGDAWTWRALRNPSLVTVSPLAKGAVQGFGLLQRDRRFLDYQDLEADYQKRPSYWVEPVGDWGRGTVNLLEIPTKSEALDNIGLFWTPDAPVPAGGTMDIAYSIMADDNGSRLHGLGRVFKTFQTEPNTDGNKPATPGESCRYLIDFAGGALARYLDAPDSLKIDATTQVGQIIGATLMPNREIGGFRAMLDVHLSPADSGTMTLRLTAEGAPVTEMWTACIP